MSECGCRVQGVETVGGPADGALIGTLIVYCPLHKAATDMFEALKRIEPYLMPEMEPEPGPQYEHLQASRDVRKALDLAEGKS